MVHCYKGSKWIKGRCSRCGVLRSERHEIRNGKKIKKILINYWVGRKHREILVEDIDLEYVRPNKTGVTVLGDRGNKKFSLAIIYGNETRRTETAH